MKLSLSVFLVAFWGGRERQKDLKLAPRIEYLQLELHAFVRASFLRSAIFFTFLVTSNLAKKSDFGTF
jgi:hypothetical protein